MFFIFLVYTHIRCFRKDTAANDYEFCVHVNISAKHILDSDHSKECVSFITFCLVFLFFLKKITLSVSTPV